jgi:hypothetical protein
MVSRRNTTPETVSVSADHLVLALRSYVTAPKKRKRAKYSNRPTDADDDARPGRQLPSDWVLVFDCETATTPDQRLKFGTYQLRRKGRLFERGAFYEPDALTPIELQVLQAVIESELPSDDGERIYLRTRHEFVEHVFFGRGYLIGAQIVGFNLPFDISRLAVRHVNARRSMHGGFSFILIDDDNWPKVTVKHLSQRESFIQFTGTKSKNRFSKKPDAEDDEKPLDVDRGYFVDVRTLAAVFTSESHSLESLSELLKIQHPKLATDRHGEIIDPEYVRYAMRDVQATWECFEILAAKFEGLQLSNAGLYELYSEASLGKAYLKAMGIKPWREAQPDFPPAIIGRIMGTYYGGRAAVHIRRKITPIIHCDFLSMYPTVCTLMGLWEYVIAKGIKCRDDTAAVKGLVENCTTEFLRTSQAWKLLTAIVEVQPEEDIFPVRARYSEDAQATIGLNYLTSDEPMWFTLADVLVSKILTGRTPQVLSALRFVPLECQDGLNPIFVSGKAIKPTKDDFYKSLIIHRIDITKKRGVAPDGEKERLESDRLAIKILANSTSYGIFVELNVEDRRASETAVLHDAAGRYAIIQTKKVEKPGRYFHPLLGTLITGAARLMLALAERQIIDQGLDWVFCDTDSMAIANPENIPLPEFKTKVLAVRDWFSSLNPYGEQESILQLEKVNFPNGEDGKLDRLDPCECLAVSAKRYVLFNRDSGDEPQIRKASGHGLGHLLDPYGDPPEVRRQWIKDISVPRWQADVWKKIIRAADAGVPDMINYGTLRNFDAAAASRYAATTSTLLEWFDGHNGIGKQVTPKPYVEQVKPFNFLLSLQIKSRLEMARDDMQALHGPLWTRREPQPAAPHFDDIRKAELHAFDRGKQEFSPIPAHWLKSHARSLTRYHMHAEAKFVGGDFDAVGKLQRRHVHVVATQPIGKEADNLEEREFIGGDKDDVIEYAFRRTDKTKLIAFIEKTQRDYNISDRDLIARAHVSPHTLIALHERKYLPNATLRKLASVAEAVRRKRKDGDSEQACWMFKLKTLKDELGSDGAVAEYLGTSRSQVTRMLRGERSMPDNVKRVLHDLSPDSEE